MMNKRGGHQGAGGDTSSAWLGTSSEQSKSAQSDPFFLGHMNILKVLQDPELHQYRQDQWYCHGQRKALYLWFYCKSSSFRVSSFVSLSSLDFLCD